MVSVLTVLNSPQLCQSCLKLPLPCPRKLGISHGALFLFTPLAIPSTLMISLFTSSFPELIPYPVLLSPTFLPAWWASQTNCLMSKSKSIFLTELAYFSPQTITPLCAPFPRYSEPSLIIPLMHLLCSPFPFWLPYLDTWHLLSRSL